MSMPPITEEDSALHQQIKDTICSLAIPVTSRPKRSDEIEGEDYRFVSVNEFETVSH